MNYYLTPVTSQTVNNPSQTVNAPKYFSTDMAGLAFTAIPFGAEGWAIVSLANANAALAAESDVYSFPADLTTLLQDADVSALSTYLTNANIPSDQITSGMAFADALQVIAKIFLVAQSLYGLTGSAIFTNGATLDDTIGDSGVSSLTAPSLNIGIGGGAGSLLGAGGSSGGSSEQSGPFDFSSVSSDDIISDVLDETSQQFTSTVNLGSL